MLSLIRTTCSCVALIPVLSFSVYSFAPPEEERSAPPRERPASQREANSTDASGGRAVAGSAMHDREIIAWLTPPQQGEITISKTAQEQSQNPQVKEFAAMMIKDHGDFLKKLQGMQGKVAGKSGAAGNRQGTDAAPGRTTDTASGDAASGRGREAAFRGTSQAGDRSALDWVRIHEEINKRCVATIQKELQGKEGTDFDQTYLGFQVAQHYAMLDTVHVLRQHASPDLQKLLDDGMKTTQEHLDHAKRLVEEVGGGRQAEGQRSAPKGTRKPAANNSQN